ncbi:MAG: ABC transporter substrate-binding protein [Myxococcaceae bacterium]
MALRRGPGLVFAALIGLLVAFGVVAVRFGLLQRLERRLLRPNAGRLSPGDFPAGVAAPVGDIASVPLRPTLIGFTPRGSTAALLLAAGGATTLGADLGGERPSGGLFRTGYSLDAKAVVFSRESDLQKALSLGAERGGVDMAALSVDLLARWGSKLRDASPRVLLLLGRSRGQEALAGLDVSQIDQLRGKRLAAYRDSPSYYFALWVLSRAGLGTDDVRWVDLSSSLEAGAALREGRADVAAGLRADLELASQDRGGGILASTADAPHLIATVLVCRGEFAARYPDAVRRVLRGLLDAAQSVSRESALAGRLLGEVAPYLGDPAEAIAQAPPAELRENLAFFGVAGEAPVTYEELYASAGSLFQRLLLVPAPPPALDLLDLAPLRYVAEARGP